MKVLLLVSAMLMSLSPAYATPLAPDSGTLVGTVTCGPAEESPAANAMVAVAVLGIQSHTDSSGAFMLESVPAARALTIEAFSDAQGSVSSSRYSVTLQAGETLDIGNLDLAVCPQPAPAPFEDDQSTAQGAQL